ncbi:MAG: glycine cleavage system aminomethyltransferase GcvT [Novosphingobium sp.]
MSDPSQATEESPVLPLPLDRWHRARGGRMVAFADYWMPVQYEGIIAEHLWTRAHAGLFDVSHMGQLLLSGPGVAAALETLLPGDIAGLKPGGIRYSLLLGEDGGILDDLMVTNVEQDGEARYYLVVNGATKWDDIGELREHLPDEVTINHLEDQALLALQGPAAAAALDRVIPGATDGLTFMQGTARDWRGVLVGVGRSGYTGEDGFELSLPASHAEALAEALCALDEVRPAGLGARDSLRLEAGLPLYGHDLSPQTDPVSADLAFAIGKRRRAEGGFPGADAIMAKLAQGVPQRRVGLTLDGRMAAREGAEVVVGDQRVGIVTSGGFSPTLGRPIAMAYLDTPLARPGTRVTIDQRGRRLAATVTALPFVPHRYRRKGAAA